VNAETFALFLFVIVIRYRQQMTHLMQFTRLKNAKITAD